MLKNLSLYNFVIIDKLDLTFNKGCSIFTGETGAGKSIILNAISLTLGNKATPELIKEGTDKATIIAVYQVNSYIVDVLKNHEVDIEDNELIIRRVINRVGSSKSFINDVPVSINLLKVIAPLIIDIHEQFDNQRLLNKSYHLELLDNFVSTQLLTQTANDYATYKNALNNYNNLVSTINNISTEREYLTYVIEELQQANIQENEELDLIEKRAVCVEQERLRDSLAQVEELFSNENNLVYKVNNSLKKLYALKDVLNNNSNYHLLIEKLNNCYSDLLDSEALLSELKHNITQEDLSLNDIEDRLQLIRTLAKKHKVSSSELITLKENFVQKLNTLQEGETALTTQLNFLNSAKDKFLQSANKLHKAREEAALFLSKKVNNELKDLHLKTVLFKVEIINSNNIEAEYNSLGFNKVSFKIINNLNQEAKDLNKIASGGELARIILAIKVVTAEKNTPLLAIFDEIDIGVGGEVAHSIGQKLKSLSKFCQVLVITHSHQVAALADYHYKVSKTINGDVTTNVSLLDFDSRVLEIARMMSANKITSNAKAIAVSLLKQQ